LEREFALKGRGFSRGEEAHQIDERSDRPGFVTGHDFSRAEEANKDAGASAPEGMVLKGHGFSPAEEAHQVAEKVDRPGFVTGHDFSRADQPNQIAGALAPEGVPLQQVVLWPDTWNNYYHPQTLAAAELVLTQAGFKVETPRGHICCGRPLYDFGLLGAARAYLAKVLDRMAPQIDRGLPFIFLEPSCASVFKDELLELFPKDPRAHQLSRQAWLLADWLAAKAPNWAAGRLQGAQILLHGHCHHKAVFGGPGSEIALLRAAGATVEPIKAGCCGMAGPFGFEANKFEVSKAIANDGLLPAVETAPPSTIIVADGFSCREQIAQLSHRQALHFAEVLAQPMSTERRGLEG
jgi:Fe-S oxidoreductase